MGIKSISILLTIGLLLSAVYYVVNLNNNLNEALNDNEKLIESVEDQKSLIESQKEDISQIKAINDDQEEIISRQRSEIRALDEKFNTASSGESRDFGKISRAKPGLVEEIVNEATVEVNRCLEIVTGAKPTKEDMSNDECKDLINSL